MLVHLDTSILVDAFTAPRRSLPAVDDAVASGHVLTFSTMVLYEWLRGPRTDEERAIVNLQFDEERIVSFGSDEARVAASLFRSVSRARPRQGDLAIAACAIHHGAAMWTLNRADFTDIPGLRLYPVQRG
jgi:predicted nucleic acid-binding protein